MMDRRGMAQEIERKENELIEEIWISGWALTEVQSFYDCPMQKAQKKTLVRTNAMCSRFMAKAKREKILLQQV